jgi:hypothetical protein
LWDRYLVITEGRSASGEAALLRFEQSLTLVGAGGEDVDIGGRPGGGRPAAPR